MPIRVTPVSRRVFLRGVAGAGLAVVMGSRWGEAGEALAPRVDASRLALLSDIHLNKDRAFVHRTGISMWEHFGRVAEEVLAMSPRPVGVLVNGDCAHLDGLPGDYAVVAEGIDRFRKGGLAVTLGLGNHDHRGNVLKAMRAGEDRGLKKVEGKRVFVQRLPHADWYVLDSLEVTRATPGAVGEGQLKWLARSLDVSPNRPAVLMVHHQPDERPRESRSGLLDTEALLEVVKKRRQVKAVVYGHRHRWERYERDGVHYVNLPATAYVFDEQQPAGWVDARVGAKGMTLKLNAITPGHPWDGQVFELGWR